MQGKPQLDGFRHGTSISFAATEHTGKTSRKSSFDKRRKMAEEPTEKRLRTAGLPTPITLDKVQLEDKPRLRRDWTPEEDEALVSFVNNHGFDWQLLKKLRMLDRTGPSCRARWKEVLDPSINRAPFSKKEDALLRQLIAERGRSWKEFSPRFDRRTPMQLRGRAQLLQRRCGMEDSTTANKSSGLQSDTHDDMAEGKEDISAEPTSEGGHCAESGFSMQVQKAGELCETDLNNAISFNISAAEEYGEEYSEGGMSGEGEEQVVAIGKQLVEYERATLVSAVMESSKSETGAGGRLQLLQDFQEDKCTKCQGSDRHTVNALADETAAKTGDAWVQETIEKAVAGTTAELEAKLTQTIRSWECERSELKGQVSELTRRIQYFEELVMNMTDKQEH